MYRIYIVAVIFILSACIAGETEVVLEPDYGTEHFNLNCTWISPETIPLAIWRCYEDVKTDLLTGFLYLELADNTNLYFCGRDLALNSGINTYDNLIRFLTNNKFNCLHVTEDREKDNEFDWAWTEEQNKLQIIWRPEDQANKMITLIIENASYEQVIRSPVYYKIYNQ